MTDAVDEIYRGYRLRPAPILGRDWEVFIGPAALRMVPWPVPADCPHGTTLEEALAAARRQIDAGDYDTAPQGPDRWLPC